MKSSHPLLLIFFLQQHFVGTILVYLSAIDFVASTGARPSFRPPTVISPHVLLVSYLVKKIPIPGQECCTQRAKLEVMRDKMVEDLEKRGISPKVRHQEKIALGTPSWLVHLVI